jgi:hypothetical protein
MFLKQSGEVLVMRSFALLISSSCHRGLRQFLGETGKSQIDMDPPMAKGNGNVSLVQSDYCCKLNRSQAEDYFSPSTRYGKNARCTVKNDERFSVNYKRKLGIQILDERTVYQIRMIDI